AARKSSEGLFACLVPRAGSACGACGARQPAGAAVARHLRCGARCGYVLCSACAGAALRGGASSSSSSSKGASAGDLGRLSSSTLAAADAHGAAAEGPRMACRYGATCWDNGAQHLTTFAHPGDRDYRYGLVRLPEDRGPELETLWQVFTFFDPEETGHLSCSHFQLAAQQLLEDGGSVEEAWDAAGGKRLGHVTFVRFASWASRLKATMPAAAGGAARRRCQCGHSAWSHRSDAASMSARRQLLSSRPPWWQAEPGPRAAAVASGSPAQGSLTRVADEGLLKALQSLLDATHKQSDNWTRDRGCVAHGVNRCSPECMHQNRAPVPIGYTLKQAFRNQSSALWFRYSLMRCTVQQECSNSGCERVEVESSLPARAARGTLGGPPLAEEVNEWLLLHGSDYEACTGELQLGSCRSWRHLEGHCSAVRPRPLLRRANHEGRRVRQAGAPRGSRRGLPALRAAVPCCGRARVRVHHGQNRCRSTADAGPARPPPLRARGPRPAPGEALSGGRHPRQRPGVPRVPPDVLARLREAARDGLADSLGFWPVSRGHARA
ncbi:unnamed protein product, partial [Prorocentrum cordatum]